jgi:hypothetical protein
MLECGKTEEHITQKGEMWNLWSALVLILNEECFLNYNWQEASLANSFEYLFIQKFSNSNDWNSSVFRIIKITKYGKLKHLICILLDLLIMLT